MILDTILPGDCKEVLKTFPDAYFDCCVCSPPYFSQRDYSTACWVGGDSECNHQRSNKQVAATKNEHLSADGLYKDICSKCGAKRVDKQIGLEPTPKLYVDNLVRIFDEVQRVLKPTGTCWVVIGDTFAGGGRGSGYGGKQDSNKGCANMPRSRVPLGMKPKELMEIPWMFAFALRKAGWLVRQEVVWNKPNVLPEAVKDRCVKSHESIFLLTKKGHYYFDYESILEPCVTPKDAKAGHTFGSLKGKADTVAKAHAADLGHKWEYSPSRRKRSVWTCTTVAYKGAHFAAYPPELIRPCIKAGCPKGGIVLDPFGGSGVTGMVAKQEGCHYVLIELNPDYITMAEKRIADGINPQANPKKKKVLSL